MLIPTPGRRPLSRRGSALRVAGHLGSLQLRFALYRSADLADNVLN